MEIKQLILIFVKITCVIIVLFIGMMAFYWRSDVSNQESYKQFLNTPLIIQQPSAITERPTGYRFKKHNVSDFYPEQYEAELTKKIYTIGDKIQFHAAKSYYSLHVSTTYYLIGRDTLKSGEVVEFEYYLSNGLPRAWETMDDYLKRKKVQEY